MIAAARIRTAAAGAGIPIDPGQAEQLERFAELLADWNQRMNLTAITDPEEMLRKHFLDSLLPLRNVSRETSGADIFSGGRRTVIDVGTGAGFPGIPLKILRPELSVTLLDSLRKRLTFLDAVIAELGLADIRTVHARAEDAAHDPALRERFDICVSRAVADLPVLSEYCIPFVKKGGTFLAYKARGAEDELSRSTRALKRLGGVCERVDEVPLPGTDAVRQLIYIEKESPTPRTYPRKAGTPSKDPL